MSSLDDPKGDGLPSYSSWPFEEGKKPSSERPDFPLSDDALWRARKRVTFVTGISGVAALVLMSDWRTEGLVRTIVAAVVIVALLLLCGSYRSRGLRYRFGDSFSGTGALAFVLGMVLGLVLSWLIY